MGDEYWDEIYARTAEPEKIPDGWKPKSHSSKRDAEPEARNIPKLVSSKPKFAKREAEAKDGRTPAMMWKARHKTPKRDAAADVEAQRPYEDDITRETSSNAQPTTQNDMMQALLQLIETSPEARHAVMNTLRSNPGLMNFLEQLMQQYGDKEVNRKEMDMKGLLKLIESSDQARQAVVNTVQANTQLKEYLMKVWEMFGEGTADNSA